MTPSRIEHLDATEFLMSDLRQFTFMLGEGHGAAVTEEPQPFLSLLRSIKGEASTIRWINVPTPRQARRGSPAWRGRPPG